MIETFGKRGNAPEVGPVLRNRLAFRNMGGEFDRLADEIITLAGELKHGVGSMDTIGEDGRLLQRKRDELSKILEADGKEALQEGELE